MTMLASTYPSYSSLRQMQESAVEVQDSGYLPDHQLPVNCDLRTPADTLKREL